MADPVADEVILEPEGRLLLVSLAEQMEIVRSLRFVDDVHAEVVPDKLEAWRAVRFDVLFKGDDWRGTPRATGGSATSPLSARRCTTSPTRCTPRALPCACR
ncbi:hypothetical protein ACI8AA_13865 [Geodermatophilus sp. SYSU D01180]